VITIIQKSHGNIIPIDTPNRLPAGLNSARSLPTHHPPTRAAEYLSTGKLTVLPTHHPPTGAAQYLSAGELTVLPTAPPTGASPYPHP